MQHTDPPKKGKPRSSLALVLRAQAQALRAQAAVLEAAATDAESSTRPDDDALLTLADLERDYHLGRDALQAAIRRDELHAVRGGRRRIMVRRSEVERWLASRPYRPGPRRAESQPTDIDAWAADAEAELERMAGGAK